MSDNPYAVEQDFSSTAQTPVISEQVRAIAKYQLGFFYCLMAVIAVTCLAVIWEALVPSR